MDKLIDVTHTVKASAAPSEGARYMLDTATNERFWVSEAELTEKEVTTRGILEGLPPEPPIPELTVPVLPEPVKPKGKKLHHG
jgi:hypothetical protein